MAKTKDIQEMGDRELIDRLAVTKRELFNLRFQSATGQLDNYARLNQTKREVARCLTELREREITAAEALEAAAAVDITADEESS
jgi:large subunit ribosomal protein L29